MTTVGDTLRRERIQRKLDLDQISHELKISRRMLDAIEADQYERLPGGVFAKAFVRQYAGMLGLDAEELASQVQRAMAPPSSLDTEEPAKPALNPIEVPRVRVEEWTTLGDRGRSTGSLPAAVLVVVAMLICSAVYAWMQRPKPSPTAHTTPPPPAHTEPAPTPAPPVATPPAQAAQVAPAQALSETPATPVTPAGTTPPNTPPGPVHVELAADDAVWVLVRVDGKFAYTGVIDAGGRKVFDGTKDVELRLGNAGGMSISLNGKPVGSVGPKGQVRNVQFTSGGFQIESPKPPVAAPLDPLDR